MNRRVILIGTLLLILLLVLLRGVLPGRGASGPPPPRTCAVPLRYQKDSLDRPLTFTGAKLLYHWTMDQLIEERMNLYDATVTLACGESEEEQLAKYVSPDVQVETAGIVPVGAILARVASGLQIFEGKSIAYADFLQILQEHYREYDCYLQNALTDIRILSGIAGSQPGVVVIGPGGIPTPVPYPLLGIAVKILKDERQAAWLAHDHILSALYGSEQLLPAHIALTCLTRVGLDTRNALGLYSDIAMCIPKRLSLPRTSLREP